MDVDTPVRATLPWYVRQSVLVAVVAAAADDVDCGDPAAAGTGELDAGGDAVEVHATSRTAAPIPTATFICRLCA